MILVAYTTAKINHIHPVLMTPRSSNKAAETFKHLIPTIVRHQALRAYNVMYRGDSLQIQVVNCNDNSITHLCELVIGYDEGRC